MTDSTTLDFTTVPVEELLPHSPPMVLLDEVLAYDEISLQAAVDIHPACMFYCQDISGVPAWAGIEYMAQAISAFAGIKARQKDEAIKLGFLLGTRKMLLHEKVFVDGQRYRITVSELIRDSSGLANFNCSIHCNDRLCTEAKVNVFEAGDISAVQTKVQTEVKDEVTRGVV